LEDLKTRILEYGMIGEFLANLKREFGRGNNEIIKVVY